MDYVQVSSSMLSAIGHDAAENILGVRFCSGAEYYYFGVRRDIFESMLIAPSVGTFFNENVRDGGYSYARVA
jgi:hypothetical protein